MRYSIPNLNSHGTPGGLTAAAALPHVGQGAPREFLCQAGFLALPSRKSLPRLRRSTGTAYQEAKEGRAKYRENRAAVKRREKSRIDRECWRVHGQVTRPGIHPARYESCSAPRLLLLTKYSARRCSSRNGKKDSSACVERKRCQSRPALDELRPAAEFCVDLVGRLRYYLPLLLFCFLLSTCLPHMERKDARQHRPARSDS